MELELDDNKCLRFIRNIDKYNNFESVLTVSEIDTIIPTVKGIFYNDYKFSTTGYDIFLDQKNILYNFLVCTMDAYYEEHNINICKSR